MDEEVLREKLARQGFAELADYNESKLNQSLAIICSQMRSQGFTEQEINRTVQQIWLIVRFGVREC